jgi:uncharacterized membrane protein
MDGAGATDMAPNSPQRADRNRNVRVTAAAYSFSGPLPPPELLARYNDVVPNGAERIIKMAENQQTHRQDLERTVVHGNVASEKRGQWMGLTIATLVLACGVFLVATGHPISGSTISIADVASLAGVFVYGKRAQRQELDRKKEPFKK